MSHGTEGVGIELAKLSTYLHWWCVLLCGHMDVTPSDGSAVEHEEDPNVCDEVKAEEDEVPINTATGRMDVTPSDGSAFEHGGEPYECDHVKIEEDEVPINTATGHLEKNPGTGLLKVKEEDETDEIHWYLPADNDKADKVKAEITDDLCMRPQLGVLHEEASYSIRPGDVKSEVTLNAEQTNDLYELDVLKQEMNDNTGGCTCVMCLRVAWHRRVYV
ncbi:uncharacterized protein LOC128658031 [Bombina bombina]|uniref:uncharacterized protein LOC128658031 n=1 Tax=Bombina bombina TaxID=8345 RepID=UPI00235B3061|nr:uncharacterized protein LOC128658031 [Bombina bombina]